MICFTQADIWQPMPSLIFGVLSVVTGAVAFLLPETKHHALPNTLEEAEFIGKSSKNKSQKSIGREKDLEISKDTEKICALTKYGNEENGFSNGMVDSFGFDNKGSEHSTNM